MSDARSDPGDMPEVSILIVSCNGRALLADCLASLAEQDYPAERIEIVVYDNGSSAAPWSAPLRSMTSRWRYAGAAVLARPMLRFASWLAST